MHLAQLRLRDFRNYQRLDLRFGSGFHLLLGNNAQGKTNVLESVYLWATLRSFRGVGPAQMIRHGSPGFFVGAEVVGHHGCLIRYYWSMKERRLSVDQEPVRRLSDYLGLVRAVVFCTEDLQLIKGSPRFRRRFMDLLLAQTEPAYLHALQQYVKVLRSRNALLKAPRWDQATLEAYTHSLLNYGNQIMEARYRLVPKLLPLAQQAYRRISGDDEGLECAYAPAVREDFQQELARLASRERQFKTTLLGPHRDELQWSLKGRSVSEFGSEGQKRSVVIAMKMAQAELLTQHAGTPPILLIDDVMGELDQKRRSGLLPLLDRSHHAGGQVFMTCTEENWPRELGRRLNRWIVREGTVNPSSPH